MSSSPNSGHALSLVCAQTRNKSGVVFNRDVQLILCIESINYLPDNNIHQMLGIII